LGRLLSFSLKIVLAPPFVRRVGDFFGGPLPPFLSLSHSDPRVQRVILPFRPISFFKSKGEFAFSTHLVFLLLFLLRAFCPPFFLSPRYQSFPSSPDRLPSLSPQSEKCGRPFSLHARHFCLPWMPADVRFFFSFPHEIIVGFSDPPDRTLEFWPPPSFACRVPFSKRSPVLPYRSITDEASFFQPWVNRLPISLDMIWTTRIPCFSPRHSFSFVLCAREGLLPPSRGA